MQKSTDSKLRLMILLFACCALALWLAFGNPSASLAGLRAWTGFSGAAAAQNNKLSPEVQQQIAALMAEKASRTPAQRKLDSNLIYATKMKRGQRIAANVASLEVPFDISGNDVEVDISAKSLDAVLKQIVAGGGTVINSVSRYGAVRARVGFDQLETLAGLPDVIFIQPKQEAMTSRDERREYGAQPSEAGVKPSPYVLSPGFPQRAARVRSQLSRALANRTVVSFASPAAMFVGSVNSQGDVTHKADLARAVFGIDGTGIKIGVLSDGVTNLALSQASGNLGPVTVLPGQTGSGDEGTAMLEIVRDLVPGAQLYFATAFGSLAGFAQNIRDLRTAGCDIIVDDVFYFVETPFQDGQPGVTNTNGGAVIQAVNDVTAAGAMYFSSAGNSGNKNDNTSGVWEGDFVDGGAATGVLTGGGRVHDFGGGQLFNTLTLASTGAPISLYWSDPLGASANDYDIFRLNAAGTSIAAAGANVQDGTQDPYEQMTQSTVNPRIVIALFDGVPRFLHLNTNRGRLSISTSGQTRGHSCAADAFGVAATPSGPVKFNSTDPAGPFPGVFNAGNVLETFSSDGPRRVFFQANGTPYTPGNVSATGGVVRQKPDITAADGVAVTGVGGFGSPFFGTSAAAPHAAAIAGLIKSAGAFTNAQVRTALTSTAIDIEAPGVDRDSGAGIIMALEALKSLNPPGGKAYLSLGTITVSEVVGNGNGVIEPGETGALLLPLTNVGVLTATNVQATLSTTTPGITITKAGPISYGDIAANATAVNLTSYTFTAAANFPCNGTVNFSLLASYGNGPSPSQALPFTQQIVGAPLVITETLNTTPAVSGPTYTAVTGTQNNRLNRNGIISSCAAPKTTPNLQEAGVGTVKRFDAFTLTNPSSNTNCITVRLSSACNAAAGSQLYLVAYNNSGFVPTAIQTNYLADWGVTTLGDQTISFNVPGNANFTLVVHEVTAGATNTNACPYTLTISGLSCPAGPVCAPITVGPASLSNATIGTAYNAAVTATSTVVLPYIYTVSEGVLPPGLSLNAATGAITGTPNTTGTFNFRVTATSGDCSGFRDYSITVACPTASLSPGTIPAGTAGNAYSQALAVTPAGTYSYSVVSGGLPSGFTLNSSTGVISGVTNATGTFNFTVAAQTSNGCQVTGVYTLTIGCPTVTVNPTSLPNGTAGTTYSQALSASPVGGNYSYTVTAGALPTGLNLNSATGVLSGTPTANGTFNFTITATGFGSCAGNRAYTVTIGSGGCPTITLPANLPGGSVGQLYTNSVTASPAGSYSYSVSTGSLPPGVTLYASIGVLFGFPTAAGSYTFTITATQGACTGSQNYTVVIGAGFASALTVFSDFDGDGKSDLSIWRGGVQEGGNWLSLNSGDGQLLSTAWGAGYAPYNDLTVSGDYDGDGKTDAAVFRRGTLQSGHWYIKRSSDGKVEDRHWGLGTDVPVAGDYDGDGKTDIAVWRGSDTNWYIIRSGNKAVETRSWGTSSLGDVPVPGDYDGDGKTDIAVWRESTGTWFVKCSSDDSVRSKALGQSGDTPVAARKN